MNANCGADTVTPDLNIRRLCELAVEGLTPMFNASSELFCYTYRRNETGLVQEGLSRRYTLMTLLGLHRSEKAGLGSPVDVRKVLSGILRDRTWVAGLGDLGLLVWACSEILPEQLRNTCARTRLENAFKLSREARERRTMELVWFLSGLSHATMVDPGEFQHLAYLAHDTYELLQQNQGDHGIFGHTSGSGTISSRVRGRIGSFADQVYPIYGLAKFGQAFGSESALQRAWRCAEAICRAQGPLGQWWWHYDARSGNVVERYPVYSVHQHGMAPMALAALGEASKLDFTEPIYRGLRWLTGQNELACDLLDSSAGVIWRSVYHKNISRRYFDWIRGVFGLGGASGTANDLTVKSECRPYELGWLLYAFAGQHCEPASALRTEPPVPRHHLAGGTASL